MVFGNRPGSHYAPSGSTRRNSFHWVQPVVLAFGTTAVSVGFTSSALVCQPCYATDDRPSWIFARSTYTNDPLTGARVGQYSRMPSVEPLDDERAITSSYRRTQTLLRGTDGSLDSTYQVQAWGNGRGGIDAEWERFHDAWKESILSGGNYYSPQSGAYGTGPGYFGGGSGYGYGPGYGGPGYGSPGYGYGQPGPDFAPGSGFRGR